MRVSAGVWHAVATLDDIWENEMKSVEVCGTRAVLINAGGDIYAYDDRCPHLGTQLSKGLLDGATLTCSAHEWVFDCRQGTGINPATACLRSLNVQIDHGVVLLWLDTP